MIKVLITTDGLPETRIEDNIIFIHFQIAHFYMNRYIK